MFTMFQNISSFAVALSIVCAASETYAEPSSLSADVTVYGATPAGIAAAIAAGESGSSVLLVEPTGRIGGMVTNGLSHTDFRTFEGLSGTFLDFTRRVQSYYDQKFGEGSPEANCFRGTHGEPKVNLLVFEQMLAEQPNIRVVRRWRLTSVQFADAEAPSQCIASATFRNSDETNDSGERLTAKARVFIDATYEGDLMAAAGIAYRIGREARSEYGESLAPEEADSQVQGYNFRFTMTRVLENRVMPSAPAGYRREEFTAILPLLESGRIKSVFCNPTSGVYKYQPPALPNDKYDINDVSRAPVRLSLPEINDAWPDGDQSVRRRIFDEHVRHNVGLLYFLQNDEAVPQKFRDEARQWGWCKDEFVHNGHLPEQLYVREARRMVGQYVFTEKNTDHAAGDARTVLQTDAIAMGDYGPNCHGTAHEGARFGGRHTGEFYKPVAPYQIPYGVLVPRGCENLLVPVACSASHVGFCALRLEPIWTSLGQAAGVAAHLSAGGEIGVQKVPVAKIQQRLHARGAATIYVSDVAPDTEDFAAVQWWGTHGGLHGLAPAPEKPGQRGEHLFGQYYHAYPGHAVELDKPVDANLRGRWEMLAGSLGMDVAKLDHIDSRGDFIRRAYEAWQQLDPQ